MRLPDEVVKRLKKAKKAIVATEGQQVYDAMLAGEVPPPKLLPILSIAERQAEKQIIE
jgi:hypothetical protein